MKKIPIVVLLGAFCSQNTWASDACSTRAIVTAADVTVSDGSSFKTESFFHSKEAAAIRHIRPGEQLVVTEGPLSWVRVDDKEQFGADFHKTFALGHQYHAFLLHFEEIVSNVQHNGEIQFRGTTHAGLSGDYPYGGVVHLVQGEDETRPVALLFEFPEMPVITTTLHDWRASEEGPLPFHVTIDDAERTFDYYYSKVDLSPRSPVWFFESLTHPDLDEVQVYRLHRKLLAAHCLGDAELMAESSASETISANGGELGQFTNDDLHQRFKGLFQRVNYTQYHDISPPVIETSKGSDLGWIAVNVRAVGFARETDAPFDDTWAWVMLVKKIDDRWVHAGNASNRAP